MRRDGGRGGAIERSSRCLHSRADKGCVSRLRPRFAASHSDETLLRLVREETLACDDSCGAWEPRGQRSRCHVLPLGDLYTTTR